MSLPICWIRGSSDFSWAICPAGISHSPASRTRFAKSRSAAVTSPSPVSVMSWFGGTGTPGSPAAQAARGGSTSNATTAKAAQAR